MCGCLGMFCLSMDVSMNVYIIIVWLQCQISERKRERGERARESMCVVTVADR